MDSDFWHARWGAGQIGFHEGTPNELLTRHASVLGERRRVLVPLCGKSEDLAFLAGLGHTVVGVELVESAVQAFFAAHDAAPVVTRLGALTRYEAASIVIFAGDLFATTRELLGPVDALYDRAALIALPEPMRRDYARHLHTLLPPAAPGLVVTIDYDQAKLPGPPFAVPEAELRAHYAGRRLELLSEATAAGNPRLAAVGAIERAYAIGA